MTTEQARPALAAAARGSNSWRPLLQVTTASLITLPAVLHADSGSGSYLGAALVFAVALSAVWIACAVGLSLRPSPALVMDASAGPPSTASAAEVVTAAAAAAAAAAASAVPTRSVAPAAADVPRPVTATATATAQPLSRIPVARVPADQAVHADVDGRVTPANAVTSTTGAVR